MFQKISKYHLALLGLFFIAAAPVSCVGPKATTVPNTAAGPQNDWEKLMVQVNSASDDIEKGISRKDSKDSVLVSIEQMKSALTQLRSVKPPKGSADLFRQYVEAGSGIMRDVEDQVSHAYWEKAQASFARIKDLQKDIEKDFAPGIWSRIRLWNAR